MPMSGKNWIYFKNGKIYSKLIKNVKNTFELFERWNAQMVDYILINRFSGQIREKLTSVDANWPCRLGQFAQPRSIFPRIDLKNG